MLSVYSRGIRTSIRTNSAPYGYSVMITVSLGAMVTLQQQPKLNELFSFVLGAGAGFAVVEAAVSNFFRERVRGEPSEVVLLGSALGFVSISAGLATTIGVGNLFGSWVSWLLAPFAATVVYLLVVGLEVAMAHGIEDAAKRKS